MTNDLKAAAERWRSQSYNRTNEEQFYEWWGPKIEQDDACLLASAYLADLAERERREAERALPITEDWLREIGFEWENNPCGFGQYVLRDRELRVAGPRGDWQWWIGSVLCSHLSQITTRGQLLDLLAVLGARKAGE